MDVEDEQKKWSHSIDIMPRADKLTGCVQYMYIFRLIQLSPVTYTYTIWKDVTEKQSEKKHNKSQRMKHFSERERLKASTCSIDFECMRNMADRIGAPTIDRKYAKIEILKISTCWEKREKRAREWDIEKNESWRKTWTGFNKTVHAIGAHCTQCTLYLSFLLYHSHLHCSLFIRIFLLNFSRNNWANYIQDNLDLWHELSLGRKNFINFRELATTCWKLKRKKTVPL